MAFSFRNKGPEEKMCSCKKRKFLNCEHTTLTYRETPRSETSVAKSNIYTHLYI